jgi:hypothetical protein
MILEQSKSFARLGDDWKAGWILEADMENAISSLNESVFSVYVIATLRQVLPWTSYNNRAKFLVDEKKFQFRRIHDSSHAHNKFRFCHLGSTSFARSRLVLWVSATF